jgi:hypothetical protein
LVGKSRKLNSSTSNVNLSMPCVLYFYRVHSVI